MEQPKRDARCFAQEVDLRFCDCDRWGRARIETLLSVMADLAGVAYAAKGFSHAWLWERDSVFLITRASIRVRRPPTTDERLTVETWEVGIKGAQYYRDFRFWDSAGNAVAEGRTAWVVVNPVTRAIQKPAAFPGRFDPVPGKIADALPPDRLKPAGAFAPAGERTIVYSDIDGNGHTYNARYAGFACDVLPAALLEQPLADFRINFKREALLGETLSLETALSSRCAWVVGTLRGAASFEAEFQFGG